MRRHLHIGWSQWLDLPWFEQRALQEQLDREFLGIEPPMLADSDDAADFARKLDLID